MRILAEPGKGMTVSTIGKPGEKGVEITDTRAHLTKSAIAATFTGAAGAQVAQQYLIQAGHEVFAFPGNGTGGRAMEQWILEGHFSGVLDLTTAELADELLGGRFGAGPDRLTAAAIRGLPQVISVGGLDRVNIAPNGIPTGRRVHEQDVMTTLMRTTPEENDRLGLEIAQKACAAKGATAILLPLRGVSALDCEDGPFWWPDANEALFQSLRNWVAGVELIELDLHIDDPAFARIAAETLLRLMARK